MSAALCVACSTASPSPSADNGVSDQRLYLENRGGPAYNVVINDRVVTTVPCGGGDALTPGQNAPALPWQISFVRAADGVTIKSADISQLSMWFVLFDDGGTYLGGPILGPVSPTCRPGI